MYASPYSKIHIQELGNNSPSVARAARSASEPEQSCVFRRARVAALARMTYFRTRYANPHVCARGPLGKNNIVTRSRAGRGRIRADSQIERRWPSDTRVTFTCRADRTVAITHGRDCSLSYRWFRESAKKARLGFLSWPLENAKSIPTAKFAFGILEQRAEKRDPLLSTSTKLRLTQSVD